MLPKGSLFLCFFGQEDRVWRGGRSATSSSSSASTQGGKVGVWVGPGEGEGVWDLCARLARLCPIWVFWYPRARSRPRTHSSFPSPSPPSPPPLLSSVLSCFLVLIVGRETLTLFLSFFLFPSPFRVTDREGCSNQSIKSSEGSEKVSHATT